MKFIKSPIILNIPHSSGLVPVEAQLPDVSKDIKKLTDWYTDEFCIDDVNKVVAKVNRFVVDTERYLDDNREPMSKIGMGAVYTRTIDGIFIDRSDQVKDSLINKYYRPYHRKLNNLTNKCLKIFNKALIIDIHSFSSNPLKCDLNQYPDRPDFCVGIDDFHTPERLFSLVKKNLSSYGYSVRINDPFSGTMVPSDSVRDRRVSSILIEVNKRLYMNEAAFCKNSDFNKVKSVLQKMITKIKASF